MASVCNEGQHMKALVVDDEPLARQRLAQLLGRLAEPVAVLAELGDAGSALAWLQAHPGQAQICFLDIQMPGPDGLHLAAKMGSLAQAPQVVFVTAHAEHACQAFDLQASDYLTKPVRIDRLEQAVARCRKQWGSLGGRENAEVAVPTGVLVIQDRQRVIRVPYADILYFKAELKYVTVRTAEHHYLVEDSLSDLHHRLGPAFIRIHRNALVARASMKQLERRDDPDGGEGWAVQVSAVGEWLAVSRRQVGEVREVLSQG
jgi:two-component system response regulator AlgR